MYLDEYKDAMGYVTKTITKALEGLPAGAQPAGLELGKKYPLPGGEDAGHWCLRKDEDDEEGVYRVDVILPKPLEYVEVNIVLGADEAEEMEETIQEVIDEMEGDA